MATNDNSSEVKTGQPEAEHEIPADHDRNDESRAHEQAVTAAEKPLGSGIEAAKADEDCSALIDRLARLQAEFENSRKRAAREQKEFRDFALAEALKSLLPILDSFDRALQTPVRSLEEFRTGIGLIHKQFEDALDKLGLRQVPAKGESFDPRVHQALEVVDTTSAADNRVLEELQRGYTLRERLLRPAMVRVARNPKHSSKPEAA